MSELEEKKKKKAGTESSKESNLRDWFKRKGAKGSKGGWVDCNAPDGKGGYKACGRGEGEKRKKYPACRPTPGACKERGKGDSWGKKGSKKKKEESMKLTTEEIRKIIKEELEAVLSEKEGKKDACYHKVKSRYKVWPSAYASGALSKCRKVGAKNWGNKSKNEGLDEEFIPGGESSKYGQITVEAMIVAIADEHKVSPEDIRKEFQMGVEEEMEHAQEEAIAQEIALDHLVEDPEYYSKLEDANLEEKKLTKKDKEQKEKYVKGMKSSKKDFEKRYGDDAEAVMYATATKMAKKNESKRNCGCGQDPCKTYGKINEEFKQHDMFDPKTGDKKVAKVEKDHHDLAKKGYTHINPQDIIDLIKKEGGALGMKNLLDKFGEDQKEEILKTLKGMDNVAQHQDGDYIMADGEKVKVMSESLKYHIEHGVGVEKNIFRPGSNSFYSLFREARDLYKEGKYTPHTDEEKDILESDLGEFGMFEGKKVPLDSPMLDEEKKDPPIGKPMKNSGGGKKYKVYVRMPNGNVKKITYGDSKGGLKGNWNNAEARKSFASRHNCADKKDRTKAGYWACRAHKDFGKNVPGRFW